MKTFNGGIQLSCSKLTRANKIKPSFIPTKLIIPLLQNIGSTAKPVVKPGDTVLKGQVIAESESYVSSKVHAPTSGKILKIDYHPNPVYKKTQSLFLESDGEDKLLDSIKSKNTDLSMDREKIINIVQNNGIVGLGGAAFPTHVKLKAAQADKQYYLIINGAECEPFLTCDHRLMVERSEQIVKGIEILEKVIACKKVYIAIEDNKREAISSMKNILNKSEYQHSNIKKEVITLKTKYPQGGEKQLVKAVLKKEVPPGKLPLDVNCMVQNVGTVLAIYQAVCNNMPLIERCVTLSGDCLSENGNFQVRIGTILSDLIKNRCNGFKTHPAKIIFGGPMMGIAQYGMDLPIIKGISGIVFLSEAAARIFEESPCIKCSKCVDICPLRLLPTAIQKAVKKEDADVLESLHISDCIECGACAYMCPSKIPLVQYVKVGKNIVRSKNAK